MAPGNGPAQEESDESWEDGQSPGDDHDDGRPEAPGKVPQLSFVKKRVTPNADGAFMVNNVARNWLQTLYTSLYCNVCIF